MKSLDQIETLIARGDLREALTRLSDLVKRSDKLTRHRNAVISLSARFHQMQRRRISGLISPGEAQITENQIRFNTLELVDIIRKDFWEEDPNDIILPPSTGDEQTGPFLSIPELPEDHKFKIFAVLADPPSAKSLFLGREMRAIKRGLQKSNMSGRFEVSTSFAATVEDFMDEFDEVRPHIVHFAGHGSREGIYLEDEKLKYRLLENKALKEIFGLYKETVSCVVFNSCLSEDQGEVIKDFIPYVVGTTTKVTNKSSRAFSSSFYSAIGRGNTIPFSFDFARAFLMAQGQNAEDFRIFENGKRKTDS